MEIGKLVNQAKVKTYQEGEVIFEEGASSLEGLGFVLSGQVGVYKNLGGKAVYLNPVPASHFFGEIALMLGTPRQATAKAEENGTRIIFLNKDVFMDEAQSNFGFLKGLLSTAFTRIENLQKELENYGVPYELSIPKELVRVADANRAVNVTLIEYLKNYRSILLTKDKPLYIEGELNATQLFLVIQGEILAIKRFQKTNKPLAHFKAGDFLGVMEALDQTNRPFSTLASQDQTKVAVFDEDILFRVLHLNNHLFFSFFRSVLLDLILWQEAFMAAKSRIGY